MPSFRSGVHGELVSFTGSKGLWLDGLLYEAPQPRATILHVHGSFGNFYANRWLRDMAAVYMQSGLNFLPFNLAGHDGLAEGYRFDGVNKKPIFGYVGHAITDVRRCLDDIAGAVDFAAQLGHPVLLQGHSLGCDRVAYFAAECGDRWPLILLSPADTMGLFRNYVAPNSPAEALQELDSPFADWAPFDWLDYDAYGVRELPDEVYQIPIGRTALLHLMRDFAETLFDVTKAPSGELTSNAFAYIGGRDGLQTSATDEFVAYLKRRFRRLTAHVVDTGDHELSGCVSEVASAVAAWHQQPVSDDLDQAGVQL